MIFIMVIDFIFSDAFKNHMILFNDSFRSLVTNEIRDHYFVSA